MKLFITGSSSFVGRELTRHCRVQGVEYAGVDAVPPEDPNCRQVDVRSPAVADAIPEGADAIIHLAAISRDQDCKRDPAAAFDVNVGGTLSLMRAAQARQARQFIFASSEWVYGNTAGDQVQTEETAIDANQITSEYALTKIAGERLLFAAHQRGFCPVTVLRFGIIYGPRPKPMCPVEGLFDEVRTRDTVEVNCSLKSGRRFVHVSDIADGLLAAVGQTGFDLFNLTGDALITFGQVIETSARLLGRTPRVVEKNAHVLNVRNPDNAKVRRALNWAPRIDLAAGLATLLIGQ
jgi:UDP-glucose 4-epimerase